MQENTAVISLKNVKHNVRVLRSLLPPQTAFFAVVKANAYGHGAERVAESIQPLVNGFAVATVSEGIALRGYTEKEILVFTPPLDEEDAFLSAAHNLTVTVCNFSSFYLASACAEKYGLKIKAHLKVNTGMNRLGLQGAPFRRLCALAAKRQRVRVTGIYSHLYAPHDKAASEAQRRLFLREREVAEREFGKLYAHLSATGGILRGEKYAFDGVRAGIGIYGYLPQGFALRGRDIGLRPAMKVYTRAVQTHAFTGGGVGYSPASEGEKYGKLTVYRTGYADGFPRKGNGLLRAEGNLCMDGCISRQRADYGGKKLIFSDAEKVAESADTISYEVLCAATRRARFVYVE